MNKSHKYNFIQKKQDAEKDIQNDPIYIKFQNRQFKYIFQGYTSKAGDTHTYHSRC